MVRMFELTRAPKYLKHLWDIAEITLRYRDDRHPGDGRGRDDNGDCMVCRPPFIDGERGGVQAAWGSGLYADYVGGGGLNPVDAVTSGDYAYPIAAFARIVAEDPSACPDDACRRRAVELANASIQVLQPFASQSDAHTTSAGYLAGSISRPVRFATAKQCQDATNAATRHLRRSPPLDLEGHASQAQIDYYKSQIKNGKRNCDRQSDYAGRPWSYNEAGALMSAFIELWRALDSGFYRASTLRVPDAALARALIPFLVATHERYFVDHLRTSTDKDTNKVLGTRYEWNYNDDVPSPHVEDTSHGNFDMMYVGVLRDVAERLNAVTAPAGEPLAFDNAILRRLANTFLQAIAPPDDIDHGGHLGCRVDGSNDGCKYPEPSVYDSLTFGWVNLASADPTVYRVVRDVALRSSVHPTDDDPNPPPARTT